MEFQKYFSKFLIRRPKKLTESDFEFHSEISSIIGYNILNPSLYQESFTLKASGKQKTSNYERLEFLGDSILGSIVSCHLFRTYPAANEGYLTQMKSKIVNRKNLNKLGEDLGLTKFLNAGQNTTLGENISGNLFEALIGAIYLDLGYEACKKIVLERLLTPSEINKLENKIVSYKGLLLEWSQKKKRAILYETTEELQLNKQILFKSTVFLDNEKIAHATETSKKKAEEKAAQRAFYALNKKKNILEDSKNFA